MLNEKTRAMIWALYENEQMSKSDIASKLGISRNSVYKVLSNEKHKNEQINHKVKIISDKHTESLIESLIEDDRPKQIIDKYLDILNNDEVISKELAINGIRTIVGAMKIVVENQIKLREINKANNTVIIENNINEIVRLMNEAQPKEIDPLKEIEEFKQDDTLSRIQ